MKTTFNKIMGGIFVLGLLALLSACSSDSEISYEEKSYSVDAERVSQIALSDEGKKVEVEESKDEKIHVTYSDSDQEFYDIDVTDEGVLSIKLVTDKEWKDYVGLKTDKEHRLIKIAVPNGISSEVKIETSKEDIILADLKIDGSIEAITNGGKIEFSNVSVSENISMKTKNDDIILNEVETEASIEATTNKGDVKLSNVAVEDKLKLRSKDGDITGTVIGSYDVFEIISEVSKGKNNLPETKEGGRKTLDLGVNNGDINLEFVD